MPASGAGAVVLDQGGVSFGLFAAAWQRITDEPKALLTQAGFSVVDIPEGHICCGRGDVQHPAAGDRHATSRSQGAKHQDNAADVVAAGNIGHHAARGRHEHSDRPHGELLDWAYGGPVPRGLETLAPFITDVRSRSGWRKISSTVRGDGKS